MRFFAVLLALSMMASPVALADDLSPTPAGIAGTDAAGNDTVPIAKDAPQIKTIDLTVSANDLWQRMRNGFSMPDLHSPLVAERQAWYLNRPEILKATLQRSHRYLYYIVDELQKRGMPMEIALLPMVESSYNPKAASSAHALGIWQFIPSTGKSYGLERNWYLDERRDIISSTNAALDYLQKIYEMHGDWHLALASYNWGEGAVGRAIARNEAQGLPADYASLSMPEETRNYVPKLQALKNIIADPDIFGIALDPIPNRPYFDTIDTNTTMDVTTAARLAEITVDEFIALNPAYSRPIIPGNSESPLVLPTEKIAAFKTNLAQYQDQDKPLSRWRTYTPRKGEKLAAIAKRNKISLAYLRHLNGIPPRLRVSRGDTLLLPLGPATGSSSYVISRLPITPVTTAKANKTGKRKTISKKAAAKKTSNGKRRLVKARRAKPKRISSLSKR